MASPTQWTWVWVNSGREWRTGKPGVLQSMGLQSQTVRHNWVTEQQQCSIYYMPDTVPSPLYITQQTHITGGLTSPSFHQRGLRHRVSDWAVIKVVVLVSGRVRTWTWAGSRLKLWDFVAGLLPVWLWMCGCYREGMLGVHHLSNWHAHLHLTSRAETVISLLMLTLI